MAYYTVKLSCLRRSINGRKQIGLEMSLKSRRGSHNLMFGGQTIADAGGAATANALSLIFRLARRTIRLLLLDDLSDDREGSLAAGVNSSAM